MHNFEVQVRKMMENLQIVFAEQLNEQRVLVL